MKSEIEARIAQLEKDLEAERGKLATLVATIPQELHNLSRELFDKLRAFFE